MAWVTEWAPTAEELNSCIDCGLCLPACPTFRLTGDESASPRGRIAAMRAVERGMAPIDERFGDVMGLCLQCRACETACPSLVPFGRMMEGARGEAAAFKPGVALIGKRFLFGRLIESRAMVALGSSLIALSQRAGGRNVLRGPFGKVDALRTIPIPVPSTAGREWDPEGEPIGTVAFLSGCVMDPWYSATHVAVIQVLRTAGYRVVAPEEQTCCGALAAHEGAAYDAARMATQNLAAFEGFDHVVVDSAGCSAHMKGYGHWTEGGEDLAQRVVDDRRHLVDDGVANCVLDVALDRQGHVHVVEDEQPAPTVAQRGHARVGGDGTREAGGDVGVEGERLLGVGGDGAGREAGVEPDAIEGGLGHVFCNLSKKLNANIFFLMVRHNHFKSSLILVVKTVS